MMIPFRTIASSLPKMWRSPAVGLARLALLLAAGWASVGQTPLQSAECPFCTAVSQTLRQELKSMDAVAIARLVTDGRSDIDGLAAFKIEKVLTGESILKTDQSIQATYFGPGKSAKRFLLMGVDPKELVWSSPLPLSADAEKYVEAIRALPENPVERLDFYQKYFEHADSLLARDCYDEFALAPYSDVVLLKDRMDRKQLLTWVQDTSKSPDRKRLYYTMLSICGLPEDADLFESMIKSDNPDARAGLDALIAAYLTIKGEAGLKLIEDRFFKDDKTQYADIYSAVMALRFHGTEVDILKKEAITKTMHQLLARPDLADLVIPDLARWGDWSQINKMCELFEKANDDNLWVRVPVINYLRACPLPEAKEKLIELEKIDPSSVKRAKTFFPIPTPAAPKKGETSSIRRILPTERALAVRQNRTLFRLASADSDSLVIRLLANSQTANSQTANSQTIAGLTSNDAVALASVPVTEGLNLWAPMAVLVIATVMMAMMMWTIATSGGFAARLLPIARRL